ncbi:hypothetical protein [uncultured Tenacibaculum sp.]
MGISLVIYDGIIFLIINYFQTYL